MSRFTRWLRSQIPRYEPRSVRLAGHDFRIPDHVTFRASYGEIFQSEFYRFHSASSAPRIIDCGANCGVSVVYFKKLYPAARITAIEADPNIFSFLESNVRSCGLSDVTLINKAVAVGCDQVIFHCEGSDAGRIHKMTESTRQCTVPVIELDELLNEPVDLLKIDIEGAETDVLCSCQRLDAVSNIFLEYHSFADTPQSLHRVLEKLNASGFRYYLHTHFCPKRPLVEDACHLGMDLQMNVFAKRMAIGNPRQATDSASTDRNQSSGSAAAA